MTQEQRIDKLRHALIELIGADTVEELQMMSLYLESMNTGHEDMDKMRHAIEILITDLRDYPVEHTDSV